MRVNDHKLMQQKQRFRLNYKAHIRGKSSKQDNVHTNTGVCPMHFDSLQHMSV